MSDQEIFNQFLADLPEISRRKIITELMARHWQFLFGRVVNDELQFGDDLSQVAVITAWLKGFERGKSK